MFPTICETVSILFYNEFYGLINWSRFLLLGLPGGSADKASACNGEDLGSIPGLGKSHGGRHGNSLQYSYLENPHRQRSLAGYSPWGHKESDTTEQLHWFLLLILYYTLHTIILMYFPQ